MAKKTKRHSRKTKDVTGLASHDFIYRVGDSLATREWLQTSYHPESLVVSMKNTLWALREQCLERGIEGAVAVATISTVLREVEEAHKGAIMLQRRENLGRQAIERLLNAPMDVTTPQGAVAWEKWMQETRRVVEDLVKNWSPVPANK